MKESGGMHPVKYPLRRGLAQEVVEEDVRMPLSSTHRSPGLFLDCLGLSDRRMGLF